MYERTVNTNVNPSDESESSLRPKTLVDYIGQSDIKEALSVFIHAAKNRNEPLDHMLLYGPPGLGKTTLAHIIANEMNSNIRLASGPTIESAADLAAILTNLARGDVLFIDEIHRLPRPCEEILYSAMEDFALDMVLGKGPAARTMRLKLEPFTLIGATTRAGRISAPLRDRFGIINRLQMYTTTELSQIISRSASILNISIDPDALTETARRSRGTPRIANRILRRLRDVADSMKGVNIHTKPSGGVVSLTIAQKTFALLKIDTLGLDWTDLNILSTLIDKFDGGPVGLETLASTTGEDAVTIEDVVEPYLLQLGFLIKTPRGRMATPNAYKHLGKKPPTTQSNFLDQADGGTHSE
jgi:Holliday junction DNA helicase RuvB